MSWPNEIFVATSQLGVYYTDDFVVPDMQPTWSAVNGGLPTLDCMAFELDPFNESHRQYVLLNTDRTIYRREGGGNWTPILSPADCRTLIGVTGGHIGGFGMDKTIEGRMWATYGSTAFGGEPFGYYALHSNDYGNTWHHQGSFYYNRFGYTYGLGTVVAQGNNVYAMFSGGAGGGATVAYSTDGGASWGFRNVDFNTIHPLFLNTLQPGRVYTKANAGGASPPRYLAYVTSAGVKVDLQAQMAPDSMWFDPGDENHQRLLRSENPFFDSRMYYTYDGWATFDYVAKSINSLSIAPYASGFDTQNMLYGLKVVTGATNHQPHVIGAVYGETESMVTPIAGGMTNVSPYTNSIPYTCGSGIVRAVGKSSGVYTYGVDFEDALAGKVVTYGVDFGEEVGSNKVSVHNVEMEL